MSEHANPNRFPRLTPRERLLNKATKLHPVAFNRAMARLLRKASR